MYGTADIVFCCTTVAPIEINFSFDALTLSTGQYEAVDFLLIVFRKKGLTLLHIH